MLPPNVAFPKMRDAATKAFATRRGASRGSRRAGARAPSLRLGLAEAEREFKRALQLNPNQSDIRHEYAHFLMAMGRMEESVAESNRAILLDPNGYDPDGLRLLASLLPRESTGCQCSRR